MYRESDLQSFVVMAAIANMLAIASLIFILAYHFLKLAPNFRAIALGFLVISWLLKMQLMIQKVEIMEVRIDHLVTPGSGKRAKANVATENLSMLFYFFLFWLTLISIFLGFVPLRDWVPNLGH